MMLWEQIKAEAQLTDKEIFVNQAECPVRPLEELADAWLYDHRLLADNATAKAMKVTAQKIVEWLENIANDQEANVYGHCADRFGRDLKKQLLSQEAQS